MCQSSEEMIVDRPELPADVRKTQSEAEQNLILQRQCSDLPTKLKLAEAGLEEMKLKLEQTTTELENLLLTKEENVRLKENVAKLQKELEDKSRLLENSESQTKCAIDEVMRKATEKFTKFHTEEMNRMQDQLRASQLAFQNLQIRSRKESTQPKKPQNSTVEDCIKLKNELAEVKLREECYKTKISGMEDFIKLSDTTKVRKSIQSRKKNQNQKSQG